MASSFTCPFKLLFLLSESYLRLCRACTEDGQFNRALKAVEFACLTQGRPLLESRENFVGRSREEKFRKLKDLRDPKAAEFDWRMRRLTPPPKEAFYPKDQWEDQAWVLAGDVFFEAQRTFDDSAVVIPHPDGEPLPKEPVVDDVVYRVLTRCRGFSEVLSNNMLHNGPLLPRIVENKWEQNLAAAVECYSNAVDPSRLSRLPLDCEDSEGDYAEDEDSTIEVSENEESRLMKFAFRKKGFACHECGRQLAEFGWHAKDEADKFFRKAIKAFYKGKDLPNFVLALCSRIDYHRQLAEFRETQQGPEGRTKIMEEAGVEYQKALDVCDEGKERLKKWGDGQHKEVDTEEAHTYMELGMFLMREDKFYYDRKEKPKKRRISVEDAFEQAIEWYEKLDRKQEVANAQYQLGSALRDRILSESDKKSEVTRLRNKNNRVWGKAFSTTVPSVILICF